MVLINYSVRYDAVFEAEKQIEKNYNFFKLSLNLGVFHK